MSETIRTKSATVQFAVTIAVHAAYGPEWKIGEAHAQIAREAERQVRDVLQKAGIGVLHVGKCLVTLSTEDAKP